MTQPPTTQPPTTPDLSIGSVTTEEPSGKSWNPVIKELRRQLRSIRGTPSSALKLNVVFHVDSDLIPNEFTGVRSSNFRSVIPSLVVQAEVPKSIDGNQRMFLLDRIAESIGVAEQIAQKKRLASDLPVLRALLEELRRLD